MKGVVKTKKGKVGRKEKSGGREGRQRQVKGRQRAGHPHGLSLQESKGYDFESETDTESIAKLVKYMYDNRDSDDISFTTLVERVIQQLVMLGAQRGSWGTDTVGQTPLPPQKITPALQRCQGTAAPARATAAGCSGARAKAWFCLSSL